MANRFSVSRILLSGRRMTSEEIKRTVAKYQRNPNLYFKDILGCEPEPYQAAINDAIAKHERVAISACHDVGKSWDLARIVAWYLNCFAYSKVITTAPTYNQVKNILWSEIRAAHARSKAPLGGKLNLTDWQMTPTGDWFALGFTPRNELSGGEGQGTQSSFQGFHAPHILVVFDEATGIPHNIWTMAEGLLTSKNVKFVAIGNPTSRNSQFFKCFRSPAWHKIFLSCFDSPNLIANGITDLKLLETEVNRVREMNDHEADAHMSAYLTPKPHLLTLKWVVARILDWGFEHPLTVGKILGQFPEEGDKALLPMSRVEEAQLRVVYPEKSDRKIIGVDIARFGTDSTVITSMHGKKVLDKKVLTKRDTTEVTGALIQVSREMGGADIIVVDETGLGGGVVDLLREAVRTTALPRSCTIRGVQFGAGVECGNGSACPHKECDKARYVNIKARMFGLLSDDLKREDGISIPDEAVYLEELPTILYAYDSKGRMVIESKEDYKKRTGRGSPDTADSLALANYGRYDEIGTGSFTSQFSGFAQPFAAGLGARKSW